MSIDPNDDRTRNEKDLTMLVQQLVRHIRKTDPKNDLCERALDYLTRKELIRPSDILR